MVSSLRYSHLRPFLPRFPSSLSPFLPPRRTNLSPPPLKTGLLHLLLRYRLRLRLHHRLQPRQRRRALESVRHHEPVGESGRDRLRSDGLDARWYRRQHHRQLDLERERLGYAFPEVG
jgi:hypothetical protein